MFCIFSGGFGRKAKILAILSAVLLTLAVLVFVCVNMSTSQNQGYVFDLKETGGLGGFLGQFALSFESQESSRFLNLPPKNDEIFKEYNSLQSKIGLNVLKFSGKKAEERYIKLKNKDSKDKTLYAVVYIYKERVVGAHLSTLCEGAENLPLTLFV